MMTKNGSGTLELSWIHIMDPHHSQTDILKYLNMLAFGKYDVGVFLVSEVNNAYFITIKKILCFPLFTSDHHHKKRNDTDNYCPIKWTD